MFCSICLFFRHTVIAKLNIAKCRSSTMSATKYCEEMTNADAMALLMTEITIYHAVYRPKLAPK